MSNISTIATYLARFSGQLQPMLEKVQGMDRRTFLLETAALLALTSCSEPSGKAGMAPMISFKPSGVPVVKRSPRQLLAECNVRPMFMPKSSPLRRRSSRMKPRFITMHNTENPSADAMQHARALNNGALRCNWHYTVDPYVTMQHIPLNETGRHADRGGPGDMYSIGIEMGEVRSHNPIVTWNRSAKLTAVLMKQYHIPLRNVVPHYYWTGKNCPAPLLTNGRPGHKWSWFISRVDYYYRCLQAGR
ncbi:MAG TPA: N-acetylmuramoyl-L-alanine amidase [Akkermansia muciniphila]|nr:N-acetylmuramoyl-L-alanine amidase [Akkermansia muciniphila]